MQVSEETCISIVSETRWWWGASVRLQLWEPFSWTQLLSACQGSPWCTLRSKATSQTPGLASERLNPVIKNSIKIYELRRCAVVIMNVRREPTSYFASWLYHSSLHLFTCNVTTMKETKMVYKLSFTLYSPKFILKSSIYTKNSF